METIADNLAALAQLRLQRDEAKAHVKALRAAFDEANASAIRAASTLDYDVAEAEGIVRWMAEEQFKITGEKKPTLGVEVKESTAIRYTEADAFAWALEHKLALSLDVKSFEKIAKSSPLPFVTMEPVAKATIATDLAKLFPESVASRHPNQDSAA